jgi:acyl carrier protein
MNLVIAVEKRFGLRFSASELAQLKKSNVGEMVELISSKSSSLSS